MIFDQLPRVISNVDVNGYDSRELPQFYRADMDMVWRLGGRLYRDVIAQLGFAGKWKYVSVDSRTSMLMPGMYPCIPGWHCDDFWRPEYGQPSLRTVMDEAPSEHAMLIVGDCSKTEFLRKSWEYSPEWTSVYFHANKAISSLIDEPGGGELIRIVKPGQLIHFGPLSWHRGTAATYPGWRHFLRFTGSNHYEPKNELRTQTQVYLTDEGAGW